MKRVFIIEFKDHLGPMWMNKDNLESCLKSVNHVRSDLVTNIEDITRKFEMTKTMISVLRTLNKIRGK